MNRANKIKQAATTAANKHRDHCGLPSISYSFLAGALESHIDALCRELEGFQPPATGRGERATTYSHDGGELVVHYDYEPGEPQTRDEPGCDADVTVTGIYANGMDVLNLLEDTETMQSIEAACFTAITESIAEAKYDAAEYRYQQRRDDALELQS